MGISLTVERTGSFNGGSRGFVRRNVAEMPSTRWIRRKGIENKSLHSGEINNGG